MHFFGIALLHEMLPVAEGARLACTLWFLGGGADGAAPARVARCATSAPHSGTRRGTTARKL